MAASFHTYTKLGMSAMNGYIRMGSDGSAIQVRLLSAYTPNIDTHQYLSDVLGAGTEVATGLGYTAGGVTLTSVSLSTNASTHNTYLTGTVPAWSSSPTFVASYAVFYDSNYQGSAAAGTSTMSLLAYWDFGGAVTANGVSFTLNIASSPAPGGIINLTAS